MMQKITYFMFAVTVSLLCLTWGGIVTAVDLDVEQRYMFFQDKGRLPEQVEDEYSISVMRITQEGDITTDTSYTVEIDAYYVSLGDSLLDGTLRISHLMENGQVDVGLLREDWTIGEWREMNVGQTPNTAISLVSPETSFGQLMGRFSIDMTDYNVESYIFVGHREQAYPGPSLRYRIPTIQSTTRDDETFLGNNALGLRIRPLFSSDYSMSMHIYYGYSRQAALSFDQGFVETYSTIFQTGATLETLVWDHRTWIQGFYRDNFRDIDRKKRSYIALNGGIEVFLYDFAGFDTNLIGDGFYDSRSVKRNSILGNALKISMEGIQRSFQPWEYRISVARDLDFNSTWMSMSIGKHVIDASIVLLMSYQKISDGDVESFQDFFSQDDMLALVMEVSY